MVDIVTRLGKGSPLTNAEVDANFTNLAEVSGVTGEPMGHEDRTTSTISFNASTRTFTIAPVASSFTVWCKGKKVVVSSAQTVTIPNTTGMYSIYYDANGTLAAKAGYFTFSLEAPTAYVYWNATAGTCPYFGDERHGVVLDWQTHEYLHRTRGAALASGFAASGYVLGGNGSSNTHAQLTLEGGTFFDEDMKIIVTATNTPTAGTWEQDLLSPARIPVLYLSGDAWVIDAPTDYPLKQGTARPRYNAYSGGVWSVADVANNKYATTWILATNNLTYPVIAIIGQAESDLQSAAEAVDFTELQLPGFPSVEFRPLYKLVFQCADSFSNTVHASLVSITDIRSIAAAGTAASIVTDHGNLTGLSDDDHPQYIHVDTLRTVSAAVKASFLPSQTSNAGKFLQTDGTATSWQALTSGNVTTALGFTPYNATNPSGYISGITSGDVTTALGFTPYNATNPSGYVTAAGARGAISVTGAGSYDSATGVINIVGGVTSFNTRTGAITLSSTDVTTALGFTPYNNSNPSGYITGITSTMVTTALGFTPYNSSNPNSYISGITSSMVTTALGFTPYNATNPSGYITSSALSGYLTSASAASTYLPLSGGTLSGNLTVSGGDIYLTSNKWIYFQYTAGGEQIRINNSSAGHLDVYSQTNARFADVRARNFVMGDGSIVLHSSNYTNYALPLSGGTMSGSPILSAGVPLRFSGWGEEHQIFVQDYGSGNGGTRMVFRAADDATYNQGWEFRSIKWDGTSYNRFYIPGDGSVPLFSSNAILHAGNYSSYALPLSGGTLTGQLNVNNSGSATAVMRLWSAGSSIWSVGVGDSSGTNFNISSDFGSFLINKGTGNVTTSGQFYAGSSNLVLHAGNYTSYALKRMGTSNNNIDSDYGEGSLTFDPVPTGTPPVSSPNIRTLNLGDNFNRRTQLAFPYETDRAFFRRRIDSGWGSWREFIHDGNYNSYALPLSGGTLSGTLTMASGVPWQVLAPGSGTYNRHTQYINGSEYTLEAALTSDSSGASKLPITFTWRGGYSATGGLQLTGGSSATLGGNAVLHAGNSLNYRARSLNAVRTTNSNFNDLSTAVDTFTAGTNYIPSGGAYNQPADGDHHYLAWGGIEGSAVWAAQIDINFYDDRVWFRRQSGSSWQAWRQFIHDGNYTSYSPSLTGSGASGTWGISISGNAASVSGISAGQFFNNMGNNHSTYTDFNNVPGFGAYYVQQGTNSPTGTANNQWYGFTLGLGNEYALSSYGTQIYWPRRAQNGSTYIYIRDREGGSWTSWTKVQAGYADSAGSATTASGLSNFVNQSGARYSTDVNSLLQTGFYNTESVPANSPVSYGQIIVAKGIDTGLQIAGGYNNDNLYFRGWADSGSIMYSWRTLLHNGNYSSYALPLSGGTLTTGASSNLFIGRNSTATNYNAISLNGNSADSSNMGLTGGGTGDSTLYINSPGNINIRTSSFGNSFLFSGSAFSAPGAISSGGNSGFANDVYYGGVRNPIWKFGNAPAYGLSYFQGSAGIGGADTVGIHFGTTSASTSHFAVTPTAAYQNGNVVLHAGNYSSYTFPKSGSWMMGLDSYGYTREHGMSMTGGSEFVVLSKSGQGYTLVDGSYLAGEGGGFYSSSNSSGGTLLGFNSDTTSSLNFNTTTVKLSGNQILHAGNYTSYAASASHTQSINTLSDKPAWFNTGAGIAEHNNANEWRNSGFYENGGGGSNWPSATWYNSINVRHSNTGNYHGFQLAMSYYDNNLWFRSYQGSGTFQSWAVALSSQNYSSYALPLSGGTISGNQTITGNLTVSSNNTTGNGIILADDGDIVDLNDAYCSMRFSYGVRVFSANRGGSAVHTLHSNGTFTASGNITAYSDERLKTDWAPVAADFVERLAKVKSGTYTRIDNNKRQAGSSAQDWQQLLPEVVTETDNEDKTLSLAYGNAALVSAVELAKEVVDLRARVSQLESLINKLIGD